MVVQTQLTKPDEQYPLLKVDSEARDDSIPQQPVSAVISPGWKIASTKRSWLDRWPEFISACWMTLILLGITLLVFYVLSMSAPRRQPLYIAKCNISKPENNVYFHHVIPRGNYLPFAFYSDYLSSIAIEYPFLNFNVIFLIDDSIHTSVYGGNKNSLMFKRIGQSVFNNLYSTPMDEEDKRELKKFQQRHRNVNITVMSLNHYMAQTPLRYKWKMIPIFYLPFYTRIFTVWEYGGIGLDLRTFNNQYKNNQLPDRRITAILKQHNDGIEETKYIQTIISINREQEWEFFDLFNNLMNSIFNNTYSFSDFPQSTAATTETNHIIVTLSRNYRNKRDNSRVEYKNVTELNGSRTDEIIATDNKNHTKISKINETDFYITLMNTTLLKKNATVQKKVTKLNDNDMEKHQKKTDSKKDNPHFVLFYDFSVLSDSVGPSYIFPEIHQPLKPILRNSLSKKTNGTPFVLSMTPDGNFVAATSRHHPFLGHLLTSGCKIVNPKYAIENTMLSQCSGFVRDDVYCNDIFILD